MKPEFRFLARFLVFLGIPVFICLTISFFLPMDFFTFRALEALTPFMLSFDGDFYPNQYLQIEEYGDLGVRTEYAIPKSVEYYTDAYGFRYQGTRDVEFDIVIVGDSFAYGTSLSQDETLASRLAMLTNTSVYPYAPASVERYIQDTRFVDNPPDYVIVERVERFMDKGFCEDENPPPVLQTDTPSTPDYLIRLDIALRNPLFAYSYFRGVLHDRQVIANEQTGMLFVHTALEETAIDMSATIQELLNCQSWLESRGTQMIFMPVPDKGTIYFDDIPDAYRPDINQAQRRNTLANLISEATEAGIITVDLLTVYEAAHENGILLYHLDDTHWNANGVNIAVERIQETLETLTITDE